MHLLFNILDLYTANVRSNVTLFVCVIRDASSDLSYFFACNAHKLSGRGTA